MYSIKNSSAIDHVTEQPYVRFWQNILISLERDLRETSLSEIKKYIDEKILTKNEFARMFYLYEYYGQVQDKKRIDK